MSEEIKQQETEVENNSPLESKDSVDKESPTPENKNVEENTIVEKEKIENEDANENSTNENQASNTKFEEFDETLINEQNITGEKLTLLKDLSLNIYIELGRTKMKVKDVLELERGYVLELDKMASEPVDIYVNNKKIAEGEVIVVDKHFGVRIRNLVDTGKRLEGI